MRILQQSKFAPIGSTYPMPFKARIIAGNSGDLYARVKAGVFREDLYMALTVRRIDLPPLRERKADMPLLADYFEKHRQPQQAEVTFSDSARRFLQAYDWPGDLVLADGELKLPARIVTMRIGVDERESGNPNWRNPPNPRMGLCGATTTLPLQLPGVIPSTAGPVAVNVPEQPSTAPPAAASGPPSRVGNGPCKPLSPLTSVAKELIWPPK